ncbi:MAG: type II secretion system ATPase GspE [Gammaproteobacteria bacterium]|nr:type II secretion system ATPase GspE [Gammaproteobacteria bacterium]
MSTPDTTVSDARQWLDAVDAASAESLPYAFSKRHGVLVAARDEDGHHAICTGKPTLGLVTEIKRQLGGGAVVFHPVDQTAFDRALRRAYEKGDSEATQVVDDLGGELDLERLAHEIPETTDLLEAADDAPIIRLINALLSQAIRENASDIHLEAFESRSIVRFRVDGVLRDIVEPQRAIHGSLVSRLKVMSRLDIAEKRLPQDGRISLRVVDRAVDVRVSTLPTQHGERVVLRLLDKESSRLDIETLGMAAHIRGHFDRLIHQPHGIVLVTGPTGSGKTTTLYSGLLRLDRKRLNILTVEDPIEYDLDGVGQTQVNLRAGLTFARGLRSILRQDPDVVLVGEIRDLETAQIAVQASLTGHLVLSTLHTNTAIGAVTRLVDMGVESFLIASSLAGVLAQRLVRRLCPECAEAHEPDDSERRLLKLDPESDAKLLRPVGCSLCDETGYRGRTGIYELIVIDETLRTMIHDEQSEGEMLKHIRGHSQSLARNGFEKVLSGETSLEEVLRVSMEAS